MALKILPQRQSFGGSFGAGLGQGLSGGMQALMQEQQKGAQQRKGAQGLQALGFSPEEAAGISGLPPQAQQEIIKQKLQAPSQQAYAQGLQSILGGGSPQQAQPQQGQIQQGQIQQGQPQAPQQEQLQQQQMGAEQPQAGQAAQTQGPTIPQGLNQQQATQLAQLALQKEGQQQQRQERKQAQIEKSNAPYIKNLDTAVDASEKIQSIGREMKQLLDTGKVARRSPTGAIPRAFQNLIRNDETQRFDALSNELAIIKAREETGGALRAVGMVELMQSAKPSIAQSKKTQESLVDNILKNSQKVLLKDQVRDYLIQKHGDQPANLKTKVNEVIKNMPEITEDVQEGDIWQDEKTGQFYKISGGMQVPTMPPQGA